MKILLTGYTGTLGRHLARALKSEGFLVRVVLHRRTVTRAEFRQEADERLWGTLDDPEVVRAAVDGVHGVVHSAWTFSPPSAPRPTLNETVAADLFQRSVSAGLERFAFVSSVAVYGMRAPRGSLLTEASPLASGRELEHIYAAEKTAIEQALRTAERRGMQLGIFRPGPIFDSSTSPIKKLVSIGGLHLALGIGDGRNHLPFVHAADVASAIVKWLRDGPDDLVVNVTPTSSLSHAEWYRSWAAAHGLTVRPLFLPSAVIRLAAAGARILKRLRGRPGGIEVEYAIACATRHLLYSNERVCEQLGWKPEVTDSHLEAGRGSAGRPRQPT